ncbi:MAG: EamA family transporter [Candidatus Bathyarchaeota archaeon]|nr:EamA family transporter [Candidatus Bathyarchaeota archaeon]
MEIFVLYALISSLFWAIFTFVAKYLIQNRMKNYISFALLQGIIVIILFPIFSYIIKPNEVFLPPLEIVPYALISGGTSILGYLLLYYGLTKYDASSATPLTGTQSIFIVPLTYIFLGEYYGLIVILWILIAMIGGILTTWDEKIKLSELLSPKNKALWFFLFVAFLYAVGNVVVKPAVKIVSNFNFLIWREFAWFGVLLILMPFIFHERERDALREGWKSTIIPMVLATSILYFMYISFFYALSVSVQITGGLAAATGLFAVIIGFLVSKTKSGITLEKHSNRIYFIRLIGAILILIGIYELSLVL